MTEKRRGARKKIEDRGSRVASNISLDPLSSIFNPLSSILFKIQCYGSDSNNTVEADSRLAPGTPSPSGVEELDVVYGALVATQINGARLAPGGDPLPDVDFFTTAVGVMNNHAVKLDRRAVDSDLNSLEPAAPAAHGNPVAIHSTVHIGLSQKNPTTVYLWLL